MAAAAPQKELIKRTPIVYERSALRLIRVLDAKIAKLEVQLNSELEKIPSCSGLLEEIIAQPQGSPCSSLRAELGTARAKRMRAYEKFQRQQLETMGIQDQDDNAPANPPEADGAGAGASN